MESEKRRGIYTGKKKGKGTRWEIYMNEGGENDRLYSAFEPLLNLAELKETREYEYVVIHVPTKDDPLKFHHNLGRVGKDIDFDINWTGETGKKPTVQSKIDAPNTPEQSPRPATQREVKDAREDMYRNKDVRDAEKDRRYTLSLKYINAVALMPAVGYIIGGMMTTKDGHDEVTKAGLRETARLILSELEAVAELRLPEEVAYANRKTEKKEPIEAVV